MSEIQHQTAGEPPIETPRERTRRHTRRAGLYVHALALAALLVVLVALLLANNRRVTVSWVIGEDEQSLVWIVLVTAVLGWLLGIVTSMLVRRRTRAPREPLRKAPDAGHRRMQNPLHEVPNPEPPPHPSPTDPPPTA